MSSSINNVSPQEGIEGQQELLTRTLERVTTNRSNGVKSGIITNNTLQQHGENHQREFTLEQKNSDLSIVVTNRLAKGNKQVITFTKTGNKIDLVYIPVSPVAGQDTQTATRGNEYRANNNILNQLGRIANMIGELVQAQMSKAPEIKQALQS